MNNLIGLLLGLAVLGSGAVLFMAGRAQLQAAATDGTESKSRQRRGLYLALGGTLLVLTGLAWPLIESWLVGPGSPAPISTLNSQSPASQRADIDMAAKINSALAPRLAQWKLVTDTATHRLFPPDSGLNLHEVEIDYGRCEGGHFYTYVWLELESVKYGQQTNAYFHGYAYTDASGPAACYPKEFNEVLPDVGASNLGQDWWVVTGLRLVKTP